MMEKGFDLAGMFFAINKLNRSLAKPSPKGFERLGFCQFCLGANYSGHAMKRAAWCCGAWVDELLPPLKICEQFQVDQRRVKELQRSFPAKTRTMIAKSDPIKEISFIIGGIVIKMPITQ